MLSDDAPSATGVYYLLGTSGDLRYVGKASDLRRRLRDHERSRRWGNIVDVRWELLPSASAALAREAAVLAALRPPENKDHVDAVLVSSASIHAFLSGRRNELDIDLDGEQPHIALGVRKDIALAGGFFLAGPRAVRQLRLRHDGRGLVTREQFVEWIRAEVDEVLTGGAPSRGVRQTDGVSTPEQRLTELGIVLPEVRAPAGAYVPAVRTGNLVFLSGAGPIGAEKEASPFSACPSWRALVRRGTGLRPMFGVVP